MNLLLGFLLFLLEFSLFASLDGETTKIILKKDIKTKSQRAKLEKKEKKILKDENIFSLENKKKWMQVYD